MEYNYIPKFKLRSTVQCQRWDYLYTNIIFENNWLNGYTCKIHGRLHK